MQGGDRTYSIDMNTDEVMPLDSGPGETVRLTCAIFFSHKCQQHCH